MLSTIAKPYTPSQTHLTAAQRHQMAIAHLPQIRRIVNCLLGRMPAGMDRSEMTSVATLGLLIGVTAYNPSRGLPAQMYLEKRIRGSILDAIREYTGRSGYARPPHISLSQRRGCSLPEFDVRADTPTPEQMLLDHDRIRRLRNAVLNLRANEKTVLRMIFAESRKQQDVAAMMGFSIGRISQLKAAALLALRRELGPGQSDTSFLKDIGAIGL